jgi:hypothetical protein
VDQVAALDGLIRDAEAEISDLQAFVSVAKRRRARLVGQQPPPPQVTFELAPVRRPPAPSAPTLKSIALGVLQRAGEDLHSLAILERVRAEGGDAKGQNPIESIDATMINARKAGAPVERVSPRVWRWVGPPAPSSASAPGDAQPGNP